MSWSLSATGKAKDVAPEISSQLSRVNLNDAGEMETVKHVGGLIAQTLSTFDQDKPVRVEAQGSMGFSDWGSKSGPFQQVSVKVEPIHFTVST